MPDLPRHFIIPCGTSQLDERALTALDLRNKRPYNALRDRPDIEQQTTQAFDDFPPPEDQPQAQDSFLPFLKTLQEKATIQEAHTFVGSPQNPMGAELSTLARLHHNGQWSPQQDTITILSSETAAGVWCAAMLREMLKAWGVPAGNIAPIVIEQLNECPQSPDDAMVNLAQTVMNKANPERQNIIVMTGGFKSSIPVLTVVALVYGMRMVYLFEKADQVQWIDQREAGAFEPPKIIFGKDKKYGPGSLNDFVRLIIETWLNKRRPPDPLNVH